MVENLTTKNINEFINNSEIPIIVDFWAPWCGPCRMMAPIFENLSKEFKDKILFSKLNVEEFGDSASKFKIQGIPCLVLFNKGKEVGRIVGYNTDNILREKIIEILKI